MSSSAMHLMVAGLGYTGTAVARLAAAAGWRVTVASRRADAVAPPGVAVVPFASLSGALAGVSHLLLTAAPTEAGDPVLSAHRAALAAAPLRWVGYLSTTGVYGNRDGGWVDEGTAVSPSSERGRARVAAEAAWAAAAPDAAVDWFRLAGIYGPGRSVLEDVAAGRARRVDAPGHAFGRIHLDDIAGSVLAGMRQARAPGPRVLNLSDDLPAASASVIAEAAILLGAAMPPLVPLAEAMAAMSPMARSFWADNRKVASAQTQRALGRRWLHPTYREGLRAVLGAP